MTAQARIIINTCGPFRFYGEPVIKACLETATHHVDVTGEPQFIETMELKYHDLAREKGLYIVNSCGVDSIPADLGVFFLQSKFDGTINSVETYLSEGEAKEKKPGPLFNFATWESAVHGVGTWRELTKIRKELKTRYQKMPEYIPKLKRRPLVHTCEINNRYAVPFMGADRTIVLRSQRYFFEEENRRPVQIETYFCIDSLYVLVTLGFYGLIFATLSKYDFGRNLLLKHPKFFSGGIFSKENPSYEKIENIEFNIFLYGKGWPKKLENKEDQFEDPPTKCIVGKVSGMNPAYGSTTIMLTFSAIMILCERNKLPKKGGVYSPSAAFGHTSLIEQLNKNGVKFEILSKGELKNKL